MRETEFIDQNKKKWQELEELNKEKIKDPRKLTDLFIEVTNDLSFSKTHYPNRSIKVYLNNLALSIHSSIYRGRPKVAGLVGRFWTNDLPKVIREARREFLVSFLVFSCSVFIGVFSSMNDAGFARHILGDTYVEMTEEFIESGDPMKVYKTSKNLDMFTYITVNNLRVSFLVFVLGAFFGLGTIMVLISNGVMVGAFQYFFIERDLFQESFLTIWMHGTPEILGIIVAGAAGLTLGKGLLYPATYGRRQSFLIGARKGIMIMIGLIPIIIFAGFIESFATRYTDISDFARAGFIALCAFFMVFYFVYYPWRKFGGVVSNAGVREKLPPDQDYQYDYDVDKPNARIYYDIFALYGKTAAKYAGWFLGLSLIYSVLVIYVAGYDFVDILPSMGHIGIGFPLVDTLLKALAKVDALFSYQRFPFLYLINSIFFTVVTLHVMWFFKRQFDTDHRKEQKPAWRFIQKQGAWVLGVSFVANALFFIPSGFSVLVMIGTMPFLLLTAGSILFAEFRGVPLKRNLAFARENYGKRVGLFLITLITAIPVLLLLNSELVGLWVQVILWNFSLEQGTYDLILACVRMVNTAFALALVCPLFIYGTAFAYLSAHEVRTADALKDQVAQIGKRKQAYGLTREDV